MAVSDERPSVETAAGPRDLDIASLREALGVSLVGRRLVHLDTVTSTMDEVRRLAQEGEPEGTVVVVEEQTAGRGRFNRAWISPRSQNLSFSLLLRPTPAQLPFVNMAAALSICRTVADVGALRADVKWPNDVQVGGRKISGILVESSLEGDELAFAVVGIGVNVNFDPGLYPEIASTATSLYRETGRPMDRTEVLRCLLEHLDDLYEAVKAGESLTKEWCEKLNTLGRTVRVRWGERVVEGRAEGVDDHGNLFLVRPDGSTFTAVAGEVMMQV